MAHSLASSTAHERRQAPPGRVVVVGASAAGLSVVEGLRRLGYTGPVTLIGDEEHPPYDRPPLTKQLLSGSWELDRLWLRAPQELDDLAVDLRLGSAATGLDTTARQVRLADGSRIDYDTLVVATGLSARRLPGTEGLAGVHVLRTVDDALELREALKGEPRLVVVGSGFVGTEAAAVAREAGAAVTVVTDTSSLLADAIGDALGSLLTEVHREHGVRVETGTLVSGVSSRDGRATGVVLADGRTVEADAVLVGIGAVPNTGWLAGSGVPVGDGVECDATLHAGDGVWAAGDVACWTHPRTGVPTRIEHRTNAGEQGLAVARNILADGPPTAFDPVPFVWSDQYDLRTQIYGRTRGADRIRITEGSTGERRLVAVYGSRGRVCGVVGINMPRQTRGARALVAEGADWDSVPEGHELPVAP